MYSYVIEAGDKESVVCQAEFWLLRILLPINHLKIHISLVIKRQYKHFVD